MKRRLCAHYYVKMVPPLVVALIVLSLVGPPVLDSVAGDMIGPGHPLYMVEKFGEAQKSALGLLQPEDKMDERFSEYQVRVLEGYDDQDVLLEAETEAAAASTELAEENIAAAGTPALDDDLKVIARQKAFEERYRIHLQKMKSLQQRLPQSQGLSVAIQRQEQRMAQLSGSAEQLRTQLQERAQVQVRIQEHQGQVVVDIPDNPAIQPVGQKLSHQLMCSVPQEVYQKIEAEGVTQEVIDQIAHEAWVSPKLITVIPSSLILGVAQSGEIPQDALTQLQPTVMNRLALECDVPAGLLTKIQNGQVQISAGVKADPRMIQEAVMAIQGQTQTQRGQTQTQQGQYGAQGRILT